MRVFKVRLAVDANRLHLIRFLKESEKSAAGGRSLSQPESKALRFFLKINRGFITQRRIHMSKFYKVLLVVSLFLMEVLDLHDRVWALE